MEKCIFGDILLLVGFIERVSQIDHKSPYLIMTQELFSELRKVFHFRFSTFSLPFVVSCNPHYILRVNLLRLLNFEC